MFSKIIEAWRNWRQDAVIQAMLDSTEGGVHEDIRVLTSR